MYTRSFSTILSILGFAFALFVAGMVFGISSAAALEECSKGINRHSGYSSVELSTHCSTSQVSVVAETSSANDYFYKVFYYWDKNNWKSFRLGSDADTYNWYQSRIEANIVLSEEQIAYGSAYAIYVCTDVGDEWKCGWHTQEYQHVDPTVTLPPDDDDDDYVIPPPPPPTSSTSGGSTTSSSSSGATGSTSSSSGGTTSSSSNGSTSSTSGGGTTSSSSGTGNSSGGTTTPPPAGTVLPPPGYTLVFSDEFNNLSLRDEGCDSGTWTSFWCNWGVRHLDNNGDLIMKADPNYNGDGNQTLADLGLTTHEVTNGVLSMYGYPIPDSHQWQFHDFDYAGGMISAEQLQKHAYAYWEVRFRVPSVSQGQQWTIWLRGEDGDHGVDLIDIRGTSPNTMLSYAYQSSQQLHQHEHPLDNVGDWHTIGVLRDAGAITWYLDGEEVTTIDNFSDDSWFINVVPEVATSEAGPVTSTSAWPMKIQIDYVRIYTPIP